MTGWQGDVSTRARRAAARTAYILLDLILRAVILAELGTVILLWVRK